MKASKQKRKMTFFLYVCLRTIGLQDHYPRFISMGVSRAAHLSALTMEDYSKLGVHTMEERSRLFQLVQLAKSVDLECLGFEDGDDDDGGGGDKDGNVADRSFIYDGCKDQEYIHDNEQDAISKPSCLRRRLDFGYENMNHHRQELFSNSKGAVQGYARQNRTDRPVQDKVSAILPVQHKSDTASAVVCGCKDRCNNHRTPDPHGTGGSTEPDIPVSRSSSHTRLSKKSISSHKPNPRPATVESKRLSVKSVRHKDRKRGSRKEKASTELNVDGAPGRGAKLTPVYESRRPAGYNYGVPLSTPSSPNKKPAGEQRITVCVRKRPLTCAEVRKGEADIVTTSGGDCVMVHESKEAVDLTQYILQHRFYFDHVFGEEKSNEEVYQRTAYPLVQHMLKGGKATCFAYGQTGAGKTHTMLGASPGRPGLYTLAVRDIFAHLSSPTHTPSHMLVYVSFFEIYCGQLYDLLNHRKRLFAREDGQRVVHIAGLRDVRVGSVSSLLQVIAQGTEERTQGVSGVNPLSSRSHALLQIQLRHSNQQAAGRIWFVDLAGSERASDNKEPDRQSRMEGAEINQSLLALKECIRSLDQEQLHTPFRQSKLTQVLKDSFIGDSMTCMIANISPGHLATEHTLNTLRYADRVKELRGHRGQRRSKTISSPQHDLSISSRRKSPPKRPKIGTPREAFGPTSPTRKIIPGAAMFCSTPKTSRWGEESSGMARNGTELVQVTPVTKVSVGMGDKRQRSEKEKRRSGRADCHSAGLVLAQPATEQPTDEESQEDHLAFVHRESGFYQREEENRERTLRERKEEERKQQRRQVESKIGTHVEIEQTRERDFQRAEGRETERERHLRWYHQQLQQFVPSSDSLSSSSAHPSFSSSKQPSLSSCPPSLPSSLCSDRAQMCNGLEESLNAYRARVEVMADCNRGPLPYVSGDSRDPRKNLSWDGTEARFQQERGRIEKRWSLDGQIRVRADDRSPAGMKRVMKWAWVATKETEPADRVAGAIIEDGGAAASYNSDESGEVGQDEASVGGVWCSDEGFVSVSHSINNNYSPFRYPPAEASSQQAPAERPLSPVCEKTKVLQTPHKLSDLSLESKNAAFAFNSLPLLLQNTKQVETPHGSPENELLSDAKVNRGEFVDAPLATLPLDTSTLQSGCKIPAEFLNKLSENSTDTQVRKYQVLPREERSSDSFSSIMAPLSVTPPEVDQQAAAASFLQREQCHISTRLPRSQREEEEEEWLTHVKDEDIEFCLSFLELPQAKTQRPPIVRVTKPRKDRCFATLKHCEGMMEPKSMVGSLQDQNTHPAIEIPGKKVPGLLRSRSTQTMSPCPQSSLKTHSPIPHDLLTKDATQITPDHTHTHLLPQSDRVSGHSDSNQHPLSCTDHPGTSRVSVLINAATETNSQKTTSNHLVRPRMHQSSLDRIQCRVVQAHQEQLEEMNALYHEENALLCQQPGMTFADYVLELEEIMERKARCVHSMRTQLQPYLQTRPAPEHQGEDDHSSVT